MFKAVRSAQNWLDASSQRLPQKAGLQENQAYSSHAAIRGNPVHLLEALMGE